jgi:hypothetical protein
MCHVSIFLIFRKQRRQERDKIRFAAVSQSQQHTFGIKNARLHANAGNTQACMSGCTSKKGGGDKGIWDPRGFTIIKEKTEKKKQV